MIIKRDEYGQWHASRDGKSVISQDVGRVIAYMYGDEAYREYVLDQERARRAYGPRAVLAPYMYA